MFSTEQIPDLAGKVAIVTGAASGIGYETALQLAKKNAFVVITARSKERGQETIDKIKQEWPNANIEAGILDNANLSTVKDFVNWVISKHPKIDILINNAGIFCPEFSLCDGIESQMMVNHLSHFHLTLSLLPNLNSPSRVINVSSEAGHHLKSTNLDFNELNDAKKYSKINGYSMSKLSQILFTKILTQKLGVDSNIYVHALHPGRVATGISRSLGAPQWLKSIVIPIFNAFFALSPKDGALTTLYTATSPEILEKNLRGIYWYPIAVPYDLKGNPAEDQELAEKNWTWSIEQVERILGKQNYSIS